MDYVTILGLIAGTLTTTSFVPQLAKVWKTKSVQDISTNMLLILSTGIFLWIIYGILISSFPLIVSNTISFVLVLSILILKIKYQNRT